MNTESMQQSILEKTMQRTLQGTIPQAEKVSREQNQTWICGSSNACKAGTCWCITQGVF
jgi:hypothetical protein